MADHEDPTPASKKEMSCPACHSSIKVAPTNDGQQPLQYCPYCGILLPHYDPSVGETLDSATASSLSHVTLIQGHVPEDEPIQFTIGPYQVLRSIGKGGMGEVFLAYDTTCGRRIALKRIRTDLSNHRLLYNRFIKEARITSQLTHPSIIPIYAIHSDEHLIYYTMPFVEGDTLKQILRKTRRQEKAGQKLDHLGGSIPALIRLFINICQAVAYAHSKGVLHRDLKPENIIIGKYGEALILDWGLAKMLRSNDEEGIEGAVEEGSNPFHELTHMGKVVGTVTYMAPERALGAPATVETDIYALGVILYQLLTLHTPFSRGTLKEFQKTVHDEVFVDPTEVAPYRDVPRLLSQIVKKCLSPKPAQRYHYVEELIHELANYIEGRSEWFQVAELDTNNKNDWEFQENVLIAEHAAITRHAEVSDWVSLMVSKVSVTGNTKIEAEIRLGEKSHGIGFLLSIPEAEEREHLIDGYCLWLGAENFKGARLLRSAVEVMNSPDIFLERFNWYRFRIEKVDTNVHFYLNNVLQFSYISHSPLVGTHVGIVARDANYEIADFCVFAGSQNIMVNCLAVPDAYLAIKEYTKALNEYRRIGYSFPGRAEGREAMFRAGVSLIEQARNEPDAAKGSQIYDLALVEFEKLHSTPGAPLEYLGKALVYEALHDYEEEIKCFELACRRYFNHPMLPVLQEQIVYRMHESSHHHRVATYNFILLVVRHLPEVAKSNPVKKLFSSLQKHWEPLYFFENGDPLTALQFATRLAFWLAKPYVLVEICNDLLKEPEPSTKDIGNALFALLELGAWKLAEDQINKIYKELPPEKLEKLKPSLEAIKIALLCHISSLPTAFHSFFSRRKLHLAVEDVRVLVYMMEQAIAMQLPQLVLQQEPFLQKCEISQEDRFPIDCILIWAALAVKEWDKAAQIFHTYPMEIISKDNTLLHFLYGCWLSYSESREITTIHFSSILEVSFPRSYTLFSHYLTGKIDAEQRWFQKAFLWEKRQLYRQAELYYHCIGDREKTHHYHQLAKQESIDVEL